ncbi:hypothetical protein ASPVEDRAFT_785848 [Aspergillus versicolor CBS 583.65]|uniref:Uncharacterized protein n=1 Tax=Aspergillus versicolor CBS 583.65 TaxID=1036611 RepID=A0A1L9PSA6_ASPVE|nr:uncharacterized protein ASPVEDRAFT_785848 [Aspergillus versicolor CBS 583.65]OJJ04383.1 hypothetical protein ASPVEDRAFT_785848 [Aspergillus versicolor CBS 583.65]
MLTRLGSGHSSLIRLAYFPQPPDKNGDKTASPIKASVTVCHFQPIARGVSSLSLWKLALMPGRCFVTTSGDRIPSISAAILKITNRLDSYIALVALANPCESRRFFRKTS